MMATIPEIVEAIQQANHTAKRMPIFSRHYPGAHAYLNQLLDQYEDAVNQADLISPHLHDSTDHMCDCDSQPVQHVHLDVVQAKAQQ